MLQDGTRVDELVKRSLKMNHLPKPKVRIAEPAPIEHPKTPAGFGLFLIKHAL